MAADLDEPGVALLPAVVLVDGPRLRGVHRLAFELAVALPQGEVAEHGLAGERVEVARLVEQRSAVPEPFLDRDTGHPPRDRDLNGASHLLDRAPRHGTDWLD